MSNAERRPRIVLADDHAQVREALGRMLGMYCDVVASVSGGSEAIEAVSGLRPDVIVVDLMMGDIDGLEVCRRVKQLMPETAVVIMTASDDAAIRAAALRDGASAFIPKHLVTETLGRTIEQVFAEMNDVLFCTDTAFVPAETAAMPWKCPACETQITHNGDLPEPRRVYRCHVCRLELVLDEAAHKLTVASLRTAVAIRRATDRRQ